jgi:2-oxoisovalerate ferredoxin oxidoreductase alpha subunit
MAEPLTFPTEAVEPTIDDSWAVRGNKETMDNLVTSIFLDFDQLEDFNFELQEKYEKIKENEVLYEEYMVEDAEIVLVSYGTSSRLSRTAVDVAREKGIKLGLLRPITLFPFPEKRIRELADKGVKFVSVEMSNGQLREDVKMAAGYDDVHLVNRMGGKLIELKDILNEIYEMVGSDERHKVDSEDKEFDASYLSDKDYQDELDNDNYHNHRVVD